MEREQDIIERNKLIAEFMGEVIRGKFGRILSPHEYAYHYSWDWLIPVCKKITAINIQNTQKEVYLLAAIFSASTRFDIKELFEAVVEFIKWYNQNK